MPGRRLVLASASPSRLRLLTQAGFAPDVIVSGVDETTITNDDPTALVAELAEVKAATVAATLAGDEAMVLGCDSALDVDGVAHGKPVSAEEATRRLRALRGRSAVLRTGHCLADALTGERVSGVASTTVWFGEYDDAELEAYVATGEPLAVAGAFTLDGYSAPFIGGVEGDPSNVIGLSLPLLRTLLRRVGVEVRDLWVPP
ncbi:MAG: nucleoside triphosphate pyrophosphatase [Acidimicrobiales bacterium]